MTKHHDPTPRSAPRDYIEIERTYRPGLTREQNLLFGLLFCIALTGAALIWIGLRS